MFACFNLFSKCHNPPLDKDLREDNWKNEWHLIQVIDVYDGDTCTVRVRRNGVWCRQKVRMMGYDTPEMKPPKNQPNREKEIELAKKAREVFIKQTRGPIWMYCHGREKYGRILATFHKKTTFGKESWSVNDWMVSNGYGKPYDGGTKDREWSEISF